MPNRYQEIYPEPPKLKASSRDPISAQNLLNLEYFEAEPGQMKQQVFAQHHILINLQSNPHRVENWRDEEYLDFIYHENEIILTPAGIASGWRWHGKSKVIVITLEPFAFEQFAQQNLQITLTNEQLKDAFQFIDQDLTQSAIMLRDALYSDVGSNVLFESFARVFLTKLIQSYGLEKDEEYAFTRSFTSKHYKAVLDHIAKYFSKSISLEQLAEQTHLSTYHFARLFKQTIGVTPHQFVIQYRIEQAKRMLSEPSPILFDVALSCGFSDQAHFTRMFKQLEGITPKQYLKQR